MSSVPHSTTRFIFVTGGVVSALGKGITAASIGRLLRARGFKVTFLKFDPYINVDPGTMNPFQHGEVFVTDDGAETDLDLGHYERYCTVTTSQNLDDARLCFHHFSERPEGDAVPVGETAALAPGDELGVGIGDLLKLVHEPALAQAGDGDEGHELWDSLVPGAFEGVPQAVQLALPP